MKKRVPIFTQENLAKIPGMVAAGKSRQEIAAALGCKVSSLTTTCSTLRIPLKPKPQVVTAPTGAQPFATKLKNVKFKCLTDTNTMFLLAARAEKEGFTVNELIERIVELTARDNLFDAIFDERRPKKKHCAIGASR